MGRPANRKLPKAQRLYEAVQDGDKGLDMHYDNAEASTALNRLAVAWTPDDKIQVTLNVNIGGTWEGGRLTEHEAKQSVESLPVSIIMESFDCKRTWM